MPHVGGGSNAGGFSSSSSGTTSIPKTDVYGNTHSRYYYRPGFYYHGTYVSYSRKNRTFNSLARVIVLFLISVAIIAAGFVSLNYKKSNDRLVDYSLKRYEQIYPKGSNYEYNVLIEIIAYDSLTEIDYMPIVGDSVDAKVDEMYGNEKSYFGSIFASNLAKEEKKVSNLSSILATSITEANKNISSKYYTSNTFSSKLINNTNFELGDLTDLNVALNEFYTLTGYNLVVDVNNYDSPYHSNYLIMGILVGFGSLLVIYSFYSFGKTLKAVKMINEEDKKGNLKDYYEGEVNFDEQLKNHPLDEKYTYNKKEYDEIRNKLKESKFD